MHPHPHIARQLANGHHQERLGRAARARAARHAEARAQPVAAELPPIGMRLLPRRARDAALACEVSTPVPEGGGRRAS